MDLVSMGFGFLISISTSSWEVSLPDEAFTFTFEIPIPFAFTEKLYISSPALLNVNMFDDAPKTFINGSVVTDAVTLLIFSSMAKTFAPR